MKTSAAEDLRRTLFQLRRRRGEYAHKNAWLAEIARLKSMLRAGSAERLAFETIEELGLTFKAAAAKLGFSERHLYRVRRSMLQQLVESPSQRVSVRPLPAVEREIELAGALLARGHARTALPLVQRTLENPAGPASVVEALTLRARSLSDIEDFAGARESLDEVQRFINGLPQSEALRKHGRELLMAQSYGIYRQGHYEIAIEIAERALGDAPTMLANPYETRALARHLIFLAILHQENASPHASLRYLEAAEDLLNTLPLPPAAELAQIALQSAFSRAAIPGELPRARLDAQDALQRAEWHGLLYETVWANLAIAMIEEVAERPSGGLAHAHAALALARASFAGDPLARTLFVTSRVESAMGRHADSLGRLREAAPHVGNTGLMRGILHVAEARVHRAAGCAQETIAAATRAIDTLESKSTHSHYIGMPYLARATARHATGAHHVHDDVEASIFYLERGGSVKDLALAFELSYTVRGKRTHLERARELRAAM